MAKEINFKEVAENTEEVINETEMDLDDNMEPAVPEKKTLKQRVAAVPKPVKIGACVLGGAAVVYGVFKLVMKFKGHDVVDVESKEIVDAVTEAAKEAGLETTQF